MEFPTYDKHDESLLDPIDAYRDFLRDDLPDRQLAHGKNAMMGTVSRLIVESIVDPHDDGSRLRIAQYALSSDAARANPVKNGMLRELRLTTALLEYNDANIKDVQRQSAHTLAINNLAKTRQHMRNLWQDSATVDDEKHKTIGAITHYTALSLLTRLKHPRLMAVSALPHQDYGHESARNFDIAVIETAGMSDGDNYDELRHDATTYKVQVKSSCIGDCPESQTVIDTENYATTHKDAAISDDGLSVANKRAALRQRYNSDIILVSGCCDLKVSNIRYGVAQEHPTADMLVREFDGKGSSVETSLLDQLSNGLLLTITGNLDRRGFADLSIVEGEGLALAAGELPA